MTNQHSIWLPGMVMALVIAMATFFCIAHRVSDNRLKVSGEWDVGFVADDGNLVSGTLNLTQTGQNVTGRGVDSYGAYKVEGTYEFPKLSFVKTYVDDLERPRGSSTTFAGAVDWVTSDASAKGQYVLHLCGAWECKKVEGFGWRRTIITKTGKWEAGKWENAI